MAKIGNQKPILLRQVEALFGVGTVCGLTDGELLERFVGRRGELSELAFTALVERHGRMVLAICRRVLAEPHDVQDAFQATFLVLVRRARFISQTETRSRLAPTAWPTGWPARPRGGCATTSP